MSSAAILPVYGMMLGELALTYGVFAKAPLVSFKYSLIVYFILSIALILIMGFVPMPPAVKIALFTVFAVIQGLLLQSLRGVVSHDIIDKSIKGVIGIFLGMSLVAFALTSSGVDLGFLGPYMLGALMALIVALLIFKDRKIIAIFGLVLFSLYITYDTNLILLKKMSAIDGACALYLDVLNIFIDLLSLQQN